MYDEVLIVGAGPVGLMLGCDLLRMGVRVSLLDKLDIPFSGSKGKGIQPRTLELLSMRGMIDGFLAVGTHYPSIAVHRAEGTRVEPYANIQQSNADRPYPNILMVPQWKTEEILGKHFVELGGVIKRGRELIKISQDNGFVTATVKAGGVTEEYTTHYLIGCDGAHSAVRRLLGVKMEGETFPVRGLFGDVVIENLSTDVWHRWPEAIGGELSLCPINGSNVFQMALVLGAGASGVPSYPELERDLITRIGDSRTHIKEIRWLSMAQMNVRLASRYQEQRVFLCGDSAHVNPPTGAQGLNTGIQDALNLSWKLQFALRSQYNFGTELLETYEAERRPIAREMLDLSAILLKAWIGVEKTERGSVTSQMSMNYRNSAISLDRNREDREVRAGDRAPLFLVKTVSGDIEPLINHISCNNMTVFGYNIRTSHLENFISGYECIGIIVSDGTSEAFSTGLIDFEGKILQTYDISGEALIVVRPDGYIGLILEGADIDLAHGWFDKWVPKCTVGKEL